MRKRLLSILLTFCMVFGMLPQMAIAEEITYTSAGDVTNTGLDLTTAPTDKNTEYTAGDGKIFWQPGDKTLILRNAEIDTTTGNAYAITLKADEDVTIVVEGDNVLKAQKCGIGQKGDEPSTDTNTTIKGNGTLEVTTAVMDTTQGAICLKYGNLTITDGVTVTPVVPDYQYPAIYVYKGDLSILGSASVISSSQTYLRVNQGTINIDTEGTITQSFMYLKNNFNYTQGKVNAWVMKGNYSNSPQLKASFVYGHFKLTYNQTIVDMDGEDGLTVMDDATLTINSDMTLKVEDESYIDGMPKITNNGTIENNGTIQFQNTVNDATILALTNNGGTLTGSGKVQRGTTEVAAVNGGVYEVASDVSTQGLDLYTTTPTTNTCYKAGNGYILWQPTVAGGVVTSGTVTLKNASVDTTSNTGNIALKLPGSAPNRVDITIAAEGENSLISPRKGISHEGGETTVQGNGKLNAQGYTDGIFQQNGILTITGDVTVNATGGEGNYGITGDDITISAKANVTAKGDNGSIYSGGNITINTTGTVDAPEINTIHFFTYTAGTITGSWVWEGKADYQYNEVNTIYGNVTIVGENYIADASQLDGLTIMQGATLTIDNAGMLTIQDTSEDGVPKIINNGTIVNNGTIKFPEGTAGAEIQAIGITGNGTIMIGDKNVAIANGVLYTDGGDISNVGVDFTVDTPTADTYYKAGDGYMIFSPTNGTLTLNNAVIEADQPKPLIILPQSDIQLVLEGENSLTNMDTSETGATAIQQGEVLEFDSSLSATEPQPYSLRVSGNGSLSVKDYGLEVPSISTDGTFVMESGTLQSGDTSEHCFSLTTSDFQMKGGSLEVSNDFYIFGNALIQGGSIFTPGSDEYNGVIGCIGNFEMTGGTVTCGATRSGGLAVYGNINKTGGTLNALVASLEMNGTSGVVTLTPYGSAPMVAYKNDGSVDTNQSITLYLGNSGKGMSCKLNIPSGSTLTIPSGATLNMARYVGELNYTDFFTNNGTIINNGEIILPKGTTAEEVKAAAAILKATGTGIIAVYGMETMDCYTNSGDPMNWVYDMNLGTTETSGDGYTWVGNTTDGFTLTLDNVFVETGNIELPSDVPVTIALVGNTVAEEGIRFTHSSGYAYPCNLTFSGSGTFTLGGGILGGGGDGETITVQGGANVNVGGGINIGSGAGANATLIVDGTGTELSVTNSMGTGVYLGTVQVLNGGELTVHAEERGIFAGDGGVTITGGSTLTVGCDYGVYIIDGKLTIDSTSKVVTNAAIAPFCVVDKTSSKAQSDMVSIANVPSGTQISSIKGTEVGYGYNYWSLVSTGGTLGVKDESIEPATLSGAVKGTVSFAYTKSKSSDDTTSGGGGGGSATSSYVISAKAEKGGTISPDGEVSVSKSSDKTFTITPNKGYEVKDVLVDGVSVGNVTEYTFKDVTKAHTITVSFVETKEEVKEEVPTTTVSYSDVKDSDWFKKAVDYVAENGLMSGTGEGKFGPNISTDRGMIVTILWRLEGQPSATTKSSFKDVAEGEYYAQAVAWAAENKIVEGYGNGLFGPKDTITREQMAAILYRYSKFKGYDTTQSGMTVREFSDYSKISPWALESVTWAVNAGLMSGVNETQLNPNGKATRAQVASILMRYCEDVAK